MIRTKKRTGFVLRVMGASSMMMKTVWKVGGYNAQSAKVPLTSTVSASFIRAYLTWTKMMNNCVQSAFLQSQMWLISLAHT